MRKINFFKYLLGGLLIVSPGEFLIQAFVFHEPAYFLFAVVLYTVLLSLGYILWRVFYILFKNPLSELLIFSIFWGCLGLFAIEWVILGNTPQGNPDAFQLSMFAWWIGVFVFPRLFLEEEGYGILKKSFLGHHFLSSALFLFFGAVVEPLTGVMVFSYLLPVWFIFWVWYLLRKAEK